MKKAKPNKAARLLLAPKTEDFVPNFKSKVEEFLSSNEDQINDLAKEALCVYLDGETPPESFSQMMIMIDHSLQIPREAFVKAYQSKSSRLTLPPMDLSLVFTFWRYWGGSFRTTPDYFVITETPQMLLFLAAYALWCADVLKTPVKGFPMKEIMGGRKLCFINTDWNVNGFCAQWAPKWARDHLEEIGQPFPGLID